VKVLVIEDEKKIASFVRKGLEAEGFVVDVCLEGSTGFLMATSRPYDVVVLDIMLPGRDGLSILRSLRERKMPLPVILLTARTELTGVPQRAEPCVNLVIFRGISRGGGADLESER